MDATREALKDAIELAEEGWGYVDTYFREKWEFAERVAALRSVLSQEPGGARTPQKTCSKCGHAWHQWDGRSMCDVDGGCLCGGDIPEPAPSPSAESDLDLLEDCWRQWSYTVDGHANHQDDPWAHDGGLSTLEALAERLTAAGRLERVSERPDKDWYRRPSALRRAGGQP